MRYQCMNPKTDCPDLNFLNEIPIGGSLRGGHPDNATDYDVIRTCPVCGSTKIREWGEIGEDEEQ